MVSLTFRVHPEGQALVYSTCSVSTMVYMVTAYFAKCSLAECLLRCRYRLKVHLFKPKNRSMLLSLWSWFNNQPAEFKRPDFVCQSEGREGAHWQHVSRVTATRLQKALFLLAHLQAPGQPVVGHPVMLMTRSTHACP
jgi:hypothetical protein